MNEMPKAIADLIVKHLNDELNDQEKQELDRWVQQSEDHQRFFRQFTDEEALTATLTEYETSKGIVFNKIKEAIPFGKPARAKTIFLPWINWRRLTAVAASLLFVAATLVWWNIDRKNRKVTGTPVASTSQDRQPASEGAVLKLADGKEIILDDANDGAVATQGNTQITKQGGLLSYNSNDAANGVLYNTLSTPKGRIYKLLLPDGSKVWLNAASSIRFPTAFTGGQRNVDITGEVYFEVMKNAAMPFHVTVNQGAMIEVLGTHFNVNAYENEERINTTLLEGSVKVKSEVGSLKSDRTPQTSAVLKPGQQASIHHSQPVPHKRELTIHDNVNIKKVMGWKDGYFGLDDLTLEELMREVERWYDVEVVYEKGVPAKSFFGKVNRDLSLLDFMDGLKDWGVRFQLEGRKLIITGVD
jgi:transmembrane sensor